MADANGRDMLPIIAITIGDPAGIGPEVTAGALVHGGVERYCQPLVIGDAGVLRQAAGFCGVALDLHAVRSAHDAALKPGTIDVLDLANVDLANLKVGRVQGFAGRAAFEYIRTSIDLAL